MLMSVTMKWHDLNQDLRTWADLRGYRTGWFPGSVAADAFERIATLHSAGAFDDDFYREFLSWMENPEIFPSGDEKSIILVAVPRPAHIVTFDYRGKSFELILPPTYYNYRGEFEEVREDLELFLRNRLALRILNAPLKGIAAVTGFARYGLNNITYVEGLGSYLQLVAFSSAIAVENRDGRSSLQPRVLEECETCGACQRACPAGAIPEARFLIHAERCLTYFSEREGPLPEAYGRLKRRCLAGCLVCQETCPVNKGHLRFENLGIHFCEAETEYIVEQDRRKPVPAICAKVAALKSTEFDISSDHPNVTFRRNLSAVLK